VTTTFVQSLARNFDAALRLMEAALTDCPSNLWQTDLWPEEAPTGPAPHGGLHGSAPWFLGYHALSCLDYDLTGGFEPWAPPQPFDDNTNAFPNRVFTKPELLGYLDWCRDRVGHTLDAFTEETAARPLPGSHRYHDVAFGVIVGSVPVRVVEHASQIRQFLTAAGVRVRPMPGDRGYAGGGILRVVTIERDKYVVETVLQAVSHEDVEAVHPHFRDDVIWWVPPSAAIKFHLPRPLSGWKTIPWLGGPGWRAFEPGTSSILIHHLVGEDGFVSVHFSRTAKRLGGGDYDVEYNLLFRLIDSQVAEVWEIADTAAAFGLVS
jgi:ketosteroid isomerase-like protein